MTLTETLQLKEHFLKFEDLQAMAYCEKRWQQNGRPATRWEMVNFIERMLQELQKNGIGYPKVLLLRKKEIQRNAFIIEHPQPPAAKTKACQSCKGHGWKGQPSTGYIPCDCSAGDGPRKQLSAWGIKPRSARQEKKR